MSEDDEIEDEKGKERENLRRKKRKRVRRKLVQVFGDISGALQSDYNCPGWGTPASGYCSRPGPGGEITKRDSSDSQLKHIDLPWPLSQDSSPVADILSNPILSTGFDKNLVIETKKSGRDKEREREKEVHPPPSPRIACGFYTHKQLHVI